MTRPRLSSKATDLRRSKSPVRQIMDYASPAYFRKIGLDPADVVSFAGGWVNHDSPEALRESYAAISASRERFHECGGYTPTLGREDCRAALADYERHVFGVQDLSPTQVAIGASSTQLTYALLTVLADPGDAVLLLDPSYCNFPMQILTGQDARILRFPVVDEACWRYTADEQTAAFGRFVVEERPKVVLLVSPDNPTSQIPSDAFVRAALEGVREVGGFLVVDFAYKEIVFDGPRPEHYSWGPSDHFLSIHSNSKWCRGLGRRLGWLEAPEFVLEAIEAIQGASTLCPDTIHQMALTAYLTRATADGSLTDYIASVNALYRAAAEATVAAIREHVGLPCLTPRGGLYTCMKVGSDGATFVDEALKHAGVLMVPGWGFGSTLRNGVRLSYGPLVHDLDRIRLGMRRLGAFLNA